jgi:hypothetical protein
MAEELPCEKCGLPGRSYAIKEGHTVPGFEKISKPVVMCERHLRDHQREVFWHTRPGGYEVAVREWQEATAEVMRAIAKGEKAKPGIGVLQPVEDLVDAAVERLITEVGRLDDAHPDPRSPAWIGRDLEVEGWERKMLREALAQAIGKGYLRIEEFRDEKRNLKRAVRIAPTGVVEDVFA